jgi:hypothetical protein
MPKTQTKVSSRTMNEKVTIHKLLCHLANLRDDQVDIFRRRWRLPKHYKNETLLTLRDELRVVWGAVERNDLDDTGAESEVLVVIDLTSPRLSRLVAKHERSDRSKTIEQVICEDWLTRQDERPRLILDWGTKHKRIRFNAACLPLILAHGCTQFYSKLKQCHNRQCGRLFVAVRRDQKYCGDQCAAVGVKKSKLEWWNKNKKVGLTNAISSAP